MLRREQRDAGSDHSEIFAGSQNASTQVAHVSQISMRKAASIPLSKSMETILELRLREHGVSSALGTRFLQCSNREVLFPGVFNYLERFLYGGSSGCISSTLSVATTLEVSTSAAALSPRSVRTSSSAVSLPQPIF